MENTTLSQESRMQPGQQGDYRPALNPSDWTWLPTPVAPTADRVVYEAARRAELDDIRRLDPRYRPTLHRLRAREGGEESRPWDGAPLPPQDQEERDKVTRELYLSRRFLVCAV